MPRWWRRSPTSPATQSNLTMQLSDLLSASTAAPAFFPPVVLRVGADDKEFVDGRGNGAQQPGRAASAHGHAARLSRPMGHRVGQAPARLDRNAVCSTSAT